MTNKLIMGFLAVALLSASAIVALAGSNDVSKAFERVIEENMVLDSGVWHRIDSEDGAPVEAKAERTVVVASRNR